MVLYIYIGLVALVSSLSTEDLLIAEEVPSLCCHWPFRVASSLQAQLVSIPAAGQLASYETRVKVLLRMMEALSF